MSHGSSQRGLFSNLRETARRGARQGVRIPGERWELRASDVAGGGHSAGEEALYPVGLVMVRKQRVLVLILIYAAH